MGVLMWPFNRKAQGETLVSDNQDPLPQTKTRKVRKWDVVTTDTHCYTVQGKEFTVDSAGVMFRRHGGEAVFYVAHKQLKFIRLVGEEDVEV